MPISIFIENQNFTVLELNGTESLSDCYNILITVPLDTIEQNLIDNAKNSPANTYDSADITYANHYIDPDLTNTQKILGKTASVNISNLGGEDRFFHGIITNITKNPQNNHCKLKLSPRLYKLNLKTNHREFCSMNVLEILKLLAKEIFYFDIDASRLTKQYPQRGYLVQYNESALDFIHRILAAEGIFYFYTHSQNKHTMTLLDSQYAADNIDTKLETKNTLGRHISQWQQSYTHHAQNISLRGYSHQTPNLNIDNSTQAKTNSTIKINSYNGSEKYADINNGQRLAKQRLKSLICHNQNITIKSNYCELSAGSIIIVNENIQANKYFTKLVHHDYKIDPMQGEEYINSADIQDIDIDYVPKQPVNKPLIYSIEQATIHAVKNKDNYGQVQLSFPWHTDKPTGTKPWIRVTQFLSDKNWGAWMMPRKGHKVIVGYIDGDPEHPIVLDSLSNPKTAFNSKQLNGLKTFNKKGSHEFYFEDKRARHGINLNSSGDLKISSDNDMTYTVGSDESITIDGNENITVATGKTSISAKNINIQVGQTSLSMDDSGIHFNLGSGGKFELKAKGVGGVKSIARVDDLHECPAHSLRRPHKGGPIQQGSGKLKIGGKAVARAGDQAYCKHGTDQIWEAVSGITIDNKPITFQGAQTTHGGIITGGSSSATVRDITPLTTGPIKPAQITPELTVKEIIYIPHLKQYIALTDAELLVINNTCEKLDKPMRDLHKALQNNNEDSSQIPTTSDDTNDTINPNQDNTKTPTSNKNNIEVISKHRGQALKALQVLSDNNPENITEIIFIASKSKYGYINNKTYSQLQHKVSADKIKNYGDTTSKGLNKYFKHMKLKVNIINAQVDGNLSDWAASINSKATDHIYHDDNFDVSAQARLMRYSMGASVSDNYNPKTHCSTFNAGTDANIDLASAKFDTKAYYPSEQGQEFHLPLPSGDYLSLGVFAAEFELTLSCSAGASAQLGVDVKFQPSPSGTGIIGKGEAGEDIKLFAGVQASMDISGKLMWANPESVKCPVDQSKQNEGYAGPFHGKPTMKTLACVSGGAGVCAGVGAEEEFKIIYADDQKFYIVCSIKVIAGIGFSGRFSVEINVKTINEFKQFIAHQIKNNNYSNTDFIAAEAYYIWAVVMAAVAIGAAKSIDCCVRAAEKFFNWIENFTDAEPDSVKKDMKIIHNILENPDHIKFIPPESKGYVLYQLCHSQVSTTYNWRQNTVILADAINCIIQSIQSSKEYDIVITHLIDFNDLNPKEKPKPINKDDGEKTFINTVNKVNYLLNDCAESNLPPVISKSIKKKLAHDGSFSYNPLFTETAIKNCQVTALKLKMIALKK